MQQTASPDNESALMEDIKKDCLNKFFADAQIYCVCNATLALGYHDADGIDKAERPKFRLSAEDVLVVFYFFIGKPFP